MNNEIPVTNNEQEKRRITFTPDVDILSRNDETILVADMPGVDETSVEALLEDGVLTLTGRRNVETPQGFTIAREEHAPTEYRRIFEVSHEIDKNKIKATVKNGTLRVILPRAEHAKPKKIEISSN